MRIGVIGYGNVGQGLGRLLAGAGHDVIAGTKDGVGDLPDVEYAPILEAAVRCDVALLAVPYTAVESLAPSIQSSVAGKVVIDATNPLGPDWGPLDPGVHGSAAEHIQTLLPDSNVVKAFNTVFADNFESERLQVDGRRVSAFIAGDDASSREGVAALARDAGFDPVEVGALRAARYLEAMAHLNIQLAVGMQRGTNSGFVYFQR